MKNNLIAILLSLLTLSVMAQETDYYLVDDSREIPDALKEFIPLLWP